VDLLAKAATAKTPVSLESDLVALEASLQEVAAMVDRVLGYVRSVLAGEAQGDVAVGRYLLDTLSSSTPGIEKDKLDGLFNSHLQVS
jgi:translation initiation factor 3 subunit F